NPTPFYINLSELRVGGKEISEHHYIAPFSSFEYPIPVSKSSKVQWKIVTDYGGVSEFFETDINL
ncbi:aggregative adherence fimbria 3 chaperone Agg3D, partial [Escherichia coli]|nr:aggregative adherence fimbria 3 chaperone Agg3D [Escherichia coli]